MEASWARICQSDIETDGGATASGARGIFTKVVLNLGLCDGLYQILLTLIYCFHYIRPYG
jgi:hypothetical protein